MGSQLGTYLGSFSISLILLWKKIIITIKYIICKHSTGIIYNFWYFDIML